MNSVRYGLLLIGAVVLGFLGGALASQLGQRSILSRLLLPKNLQVQKGFEIIDNQGKRRVLLDKNGLTFLGDDGEWLVTLNAQGPELKLYHVNTNSSVQVSPYGPYILRFAQSAARHTYVQFPQAPAGVSVPKLGVAIKDGEVIWEVP
jgi:hypothetical protein